MIELPEHRELQKGAAEAARRCARDSAATDTRNT
jgi:hypothetical protein